MPLTLTPLPLGPHAWDGSRSVSQAGGSLLDELMPRWDVTRIEWRIVAAPPCAVYNSTIAMDFLDVAREHRAVRMLFALRSGLERITGLLRPRRPPEHPPASLRLADLPRRGEWILLGHEPPNEIAFGAIGRFWAGETAWATVDAASFQAFDRPGFAIIGCNLLLRVLHDGRTAIAYEARTRATDAASRRAFRRYWRVASPFVGVVMRAALEVIARRARTARPC